MDILIKNDDFVFSYRVGGILMCNGKILLQRPKNDDYAIIGGHVVAMETSMDYGTNTEAYRLLKRCLIRVGLSLLEMDGQHIIILIHTEG